MAGVGPAGAEPRGGGAVRGVALLPEPMGRRGAGRPGRRGETLARGGVRRLSSGEQRIRRRPPHPSHHRAPGFRRLAR